MKEHFIIPTNFMESGYLFNGTVSIRNAIEGAVMVLFGVFLCGLLPLPGGTDAITYYILICGPLGLIGLFGVQGDPLSAFIVDCIKWLRRRKPYFYSGHSEAYTQEAADLLMETPQLRDMLASAVERVRERMTSDDVEYVEGKTFEFAVDPEQEALRQAQKEILAKRQAENSKPDETVKLQEETAKGNLINAFENISSVSAQKVSESLVLDELDWEEGDEGG